MKTRFSQKLKTIQAQLPETSKLLVVSKNRTLEEIKAYYELGQRDFGENRVQELSEKSEALKDSCPDIRWHMIGHLQSNKIKELFSIHHLWAIHSVDDRELLEKLIKAENRLTHPVKIFLQYNTSNEEEKSGFEDYASLKAAAELITQDAKIKLYGLMTMGTLRTEDFAIEARRCFQELNQLKARLSQDLQIELVTSMGMSQDYQIALSEGASWIRLGSTLFN